MATGSQSSDMPDAFDNVAAALLREYLHLEKDKLPAAVRAKAERALAQYQVDRALTAKELEAKTKGAEVRPDPPGTPRVDRTVDWLRDNQDLLQLLYESIRDRPAAERPTALCFSGGGIRSATFCLGVLQGLAREHRLEQFRYLSSVSGGGYIASWLSTLLVQDGATLATVSEILADSAGGAAPEMRSPMTGSQHDAVSRLRAYSNYLSPVLGLSGDMFALVSTFVRNLVLNLCVWLPLMAALLMLPRLFVLGMSDPPSPLCLKGLTLAAIALVIWGVAYMVADLPSGKSPEPPPRDRFARYCFPQVALGALLFSLIGVWGTGWSTEGWEPGVAALLGAAANLVAIFIGVGFRNQRAATPFERQLGSAGMLIACGAIGGFVLDLALDYAHKHFGKAVAHDLLYATVSLPLMLACFWVQITLCVGVTARWTDENMREWWSRASGLWLRLALGWLALFIIVFYLSPMALTMLGSSLPAGAQLTAGSAVIGALTSAFGYWSKNGDKLKKKGASLLSNWGSLFLDAVAGAVLLAILVAMSLGMSQLLQTCPSVAADSEILGFHVNVCDVDFAARAAFVRDEQALGEPSPEVIDHSAVGEAAVYEFVALQAPPFYTPFLFFLCALAGTVMSLAIGANAFSLHGMYGNRLVRAYLGAAREKRHPHWLTGFDHQDNIRLASLANRKSLFPVINMALNLVQPSTTRMAWQQRKAASFTATPLYCGSVGTGYVDTKIYGGDDGMSLGRVMTISGAAASPNMGYHSSPLVTMIMTLFNVRLGWWLANPRAQSGPSWRRKDFTGLEAMSAEAFSLTTDDRRSVYVSDGGHFENLGLYEMVRRRCHRIFVVDAGCDPGYEYSDLLGAVRKIRIDFGVSIDLTHPLPGQPGANKGCRLGVGTIRYSDRDGGLQDTDGVLYILKPMLLDTDPLDLGDYARGAPPGEGRFPQQATADQFFNEAQFESYRMLGLQSVIDAFSRVTSGELWPAGPAPESELARSVVAGGSTSVEGETPEKTPPSGNEESKVAEAPSPPSAIGGMVQSLGPGVALAAALTVGGTVGVVGTVKLKSNEITLSADDRKLLREAIVTKAPAAPSAVSAPVPGDSTSELITILAKAVDDSRSASGDARRSADAAAISADEARQAAGGKVTPTPGKDYTEPLKHAQDSLDHISGVVDNIKPAPAPLPPAPSYSASSAEAAVSAVLKKLDSIDKAVNRRAGRTTGGSNQ